MFALRSLGTGLFASGSLLLAAPAAPDGCATGPTGGTGGTPEPYCGDGRVGGVEECDGNDLGENATCFDVNGFYAGDLECGADCKYDLSQCWVPECGDGSVDGREECDGSNLNGKSCTDFLYRPNILGISLPYTGGTLGCYSSCSYDTRDCARPPGCYWQIVPPFPPSIDCF